MPPVVLDIRNAEDSRDVVHRAVQALAEGHVIALPTETVYSLAASALDETAVAKLLVAKRRAASVRPLTLAVKSADDALDYVPQMSGLAQRLARRCWPGPVTLVCRDDHPASVLTQLAPAVRQAVVPSGAVGLRVPAHPFFLDVMRLLAGPLAISSANRSGQPESKAASEVVRALGDDVAMVLDDGESRFGSCSSVVKVENGRLELLRPGVVSEQTLRRLSNLVILLICTGNTCRSPMAEIIARQILAERLGCEADDLEDRGITVQSAGLSAMSGGGAACEAVDVMAEMGLDLSAHESRPLGDRLVRFADVIWTMTRMHRQSVLARWPEAARRTELLALDQTDIPDPIGSSQDVYRACAKQLHKELSDRLSKLEL
ncbi:MAG TPA: L-threonylcarbamoyladenylate synthase [Pirellulales bacterium]|jgi:protein-tyrosine phosphatase|nr:L-threonylcarbamoyladenylate synthase [Pirellulales bacterium]